MDDVLSLKLPVGYMIAASLAIALGWVAVKKVGAFAGSILSKIALRSILAGMMFISGFAGAGFSIGDLTKDGPKPAAAKEKELGLSNSELLSIVKAAHKSGEDAVSMGAVKEVLTYAQNRDKMVMAMAPAKNNTSFVAETGTTVVVDNTPQLQSNDLISRNSVDWGLLGFSVSSMVCGIVTFIRSTFE